MCLHNSKICLTFTGVWHFSPLAALLSGLPPSTGNLSYSGHLPRTLLKSVFDYSGVGGWDKDKERKGKFQKCDDSRMGIALGEGACRPAGTALIAEMFASRW